MEVEECSTVTMMMAEESKFMEESLSRGCSFLLVLITRSAASYAVYLVFPSMTMTITPSGLESDVGR